MVRKVTRAGIRGESWRLVGQSAANSPVSRWQPSAGHLSILSDAQSEELCFTRTRSGLGVSKTPSAPGGSLSMRLDRPRRRLFKDRLME